MTLSTLAADRVDICWRRDRLFRNAVLAFVAAVVFAAVAVAKGKAGNTGFPSALGAVCFLLLTIRLGLRWLRSRRPVLSLTDEGLASDAYFEGVLPWAAVESVGRFGRRSGLLLVTLRPSATPVFKRGLLRRFGVAGTPRIVLPLRLLEGEPESIIALLSTRVVRTAEDEAVDREHERLSIVAKRQPFFAYGLIVLLGLVLLLEYRLRLKPMPHSLQIDTLTLWGLGATQGEAVLHLGQVWRLFTAPLLHGGLTHFMFNAIALWFAARLLERLVGWCWFAAIFALSGTVGAVLSVALHSPKIVGVGASGGIVGLAAAAAVLAFRFPPRFRSRMMGGGLQIVVPALLPFLAVSGGGKSQAVDVAAHAGGAVGGVLIGLLLLATWKRDRPEPPWRIVAASLAAAFFGTAALSVGAITRTYATARAAASLDPSFPSDFNNAVAQSDSLIAAYPRDPRVRAAHAERRLLWNDRAGAERDYATALADRIMLDPAVTHAEPMLRARLAQLLLEDGRRDEAVQVAAPSCKRPPGAANAMVAKLGLCDGESGRANTLDRRGPPVP